MSTTATNQDKPILLIGLESASLPAFEGVIKLAEQPSLLRDNDEFHRDFRRRRQAIIKNKLLLRDAKDWSDEEVRELVAEALYDVQHVNDLSNAARTLRKRPVTVVDACWLVSPATPLWGSNRKYEDASIEEQAMLWDKFDLRPPPNWSTQYSNLDTYLKTFNVAFVITDPHIAFPWIYRQLKTAVDTSIIERDMLKPLYYLTATYRWMVNAEVQYQFQPDGSILPNSPEPVVIDTGMSITDNGAALTRFCDRFGLDSALVPFERLANWPGRMAAEVTQIIEILASVQLLGTENDYELAKASTFKSAWTFEFGPEAADWIEDTVREAMPLYQAMLDKVPDWLRPGADGQEMGAEALN